MKLRGLRNPIYIAAGVTLTASVLVFLVMPATVAQDPPNGDPGGNGNGSRAEAVERVLVEFSDGQFALIGRKDVRKTLPPFDELPEVGELSGFWYELQSADGSVRYRRIIGDPIRHVFEGPDVDTRGTIPDRKEAIPRRRVFPLLIPDPQEGDTLVLFSSPLELGAQAGAATEVARFPFGPIIK